MSSDGRHRVDIDGNERLLELDALRGIAACVVVSHHLRYMFHMAPPRFLLRPLFAGRPAVVIFFSLSGFVLSLAYWRGRAISYPRFLIRRFFRIYLPYAAAVLIAVLIAKPLLFSNLPLTPWFYWTWHSPLTADVVARQLILISTDSRINTAFWSLRYEMELSLVFPLLCVLIPKIRVGGALLLGVLCVLFWYSVRTLPAHEDLKEFGRTLEWSSCFIFGALLALKRFEISRFYERLTGYARFGILFVALAGLCTTSDAVLIPCSCLIIVVAQHGVAKRMLRTSVPEYLGRISYSVYLLHGTILFATFTLLYGKIPFYALVSLYLVVTFTTSHIFNRVVEEPFDRLGKRLTRKSHQSVESPLLSVRN